jgi:tol-pal system protein YbgF
MPQAVEVRRLGTRGTAAGIALIALAGTGCASHADFVEVSGQVSHLTAAQDQAQKQQEALQKRLQALEVKLPSKAGPAEEPDARADRQRVQGLSARLKSLEDRLARLEETLRSQTVTESKAPPLESGPNDGSAQSKPARIQPLTPTLKMPGTPGLTPTSAFNLALNDYQSGRYELALSGFQKFLQDFPSATLAPDAHYWLGETYYSMRDYVRAIQAFEQVVNEYPRSDKVPAALFKLGLATAETGDSKRARGFLKRVIEDYKDSTEAKLAKNRLADLR